MERTFETRDDLIDALKSAYAQLESCAKLDQRLSHSTHRNDYYRGLLNDLYRLIDAETALAKRIKTIGR